MPGVNIRALNELFGIKEEKERSGLERVTVKLLMVEIYNEVCNTVKLHPKSGATSEWSQAHTQPSKHGAWLEPAQPLVYAHSELLADLHAPARFLTVA